MEPRDFLQRMFNAAVAAAQPHLRIPEFLPKAPKGRTVVIGAGKASAAMARAFEEAWEGELSGLIVTRYGYEVACGRLEIFSAAHPVPDGNSELGARRLLETVSKLTEDDLAVCLISGGGSALIAAPADGLTLDDKQAVNTALLRSGANIHEMNCVRKHLSAIKGGRLAAAAAPARIVNLLISDVPGDHPASIASGPTVPDPSTYADARAIIGKYGIDLPAGAKARLETGVSETPKPGNPIFDRVETHLIALPKASLAAAAAVAEAEGVRTIMLGDALEGEARELGAEHARLALETRSSGGGCVLLSGGETTVTVRGHGKGGRNVEYVLGMARELRGAPGVHAIACDTDGIDGAGDNAGATVHPDTLARALEKGLEAGDFLARNDAYSYFEAIGDLVMTGPTRTNVNDFRAVLVEPENNRSGAFIIPGSRYRVPGGERR